MTKPIWYETNAIMDRAGFDQVKLMHAQIWASRDKACPKCTAPPYQACRNLTGIKNFGFSGARENKFPHVDRINYDKLKNMLNERGFM